MYSAPQTEHLANLSYSLYVLQEKSHLGLDDETAEKLRSILIRHIKKIETQLAATPDGSPT